MKLTINSPVPEFSLTDLNGQCYNTSEPRNKLIMLAFFRYASCPLCNLRIHELIENYHELSQKMDIVAVFQSPKDKINDYVGKQTIPFTVLPDPECTLYRLYGLESSWLGFLRAWTIKITQVFNAVVKHHYYPGSVEGDLHRIPADFIIDTDNKILTAYYGKDIGDHLPLSEIYSLIKSYETRRQNKVKDN
ncbi:MAG: peroxiredoxin-like family protein [Bacteroidota bacterium]